jgi:hypothetical protein
MKRNEKYRCKYDKEWLQNSHEGYICSICNRVYKEVSTTPIGYIQDNDGNKFPISDTILIEQ